MAITTLDQYIAAPAQRITYCKTASRTSVAVIPFSIFDQAGNPSAGTLAIGNTANGIVPTDATAGYPTIDSFGGALVIPKTPLNLRGKELEKLQTLPFIDNIYKQHLVVEGKSSLPKSVVDLSKSSLSISSLTQTIIVSAGISAYGNILPSNLAISNKSPALLCGNDLVLQANEFVPLAKNVELSLRYGVIPIEQIFNLTATTKFLKLHTPKQFFELTDK